MCGNTAMSFLHTVNLSKEVDNVTAVLEDFEEFDLPDALNVGAYSIMSCGELSSAWLCHIYN